MDRGAWRAAVQRVTNEELDTSDHARVHAHTHTHSRIKIWKNSSHKKGILFPKSKKCWILKTEIHGLHNSHVKFSMPLEVKYFYFVKNYFILYT